MDLNRTAVLAIIAEQSRNHGKAAELWKDVPDKVAYHTGAVHVCGEIRDRIERTVEEPATALEVDSVIYRTSKRGGWNK